MSLRNATILMILYLILTLTGSYAHAQEKLTVKWEINPVPDWGWTIGDPVKLQLIVTGPSEFEVSLPEFPRQWGPFEVSNQELLDPAFNDDGTMTVIRQATLIPWSVGTLEAPPLMLEYMDSIGEMQKAPAPPLEITVGSVLAGSDTGKRDLKGQASLPRGSPPIWPWILGGAIAALLLSVLIFWTIRRRRGGVVASQSVVHTDHRYPEQIAYEKLDHIAALDLPAQGEFTRHYDLITDCMRIYLEGINCISGMEQTTGEIMKTILNSRQLQQNHAASLLHALFEESDLVKFAKFTPTVKYARSAVMKAYRLIEITKPDRSISITEYQASLTSNTGKNEGL